MICGPEITRCINEFEKGLPFNIDDFGNDENLHHSQNRSIQNRFSKHVSNLLVVFEEAGNPFCEESLDLIALGSRNICDQSAVETLNKIEETGQSQFESFLKERLETNGKREKSIFDTIQTNRFSIFKARTQRSINKKNEITSLKKSCQLFSQLYIASQVRDGDLDEFFRHENSSCPPALSKDNNVRSGTKADLLHCLLESRGILSSDNTISVDCVILDGAAIVNMLKPNGVSNFQEYAEVMFAPFILKQLAKCNRIDLVWDVYLEKSLKSTARNKRGRL